MVTITKEIQEKLFELLELTDEDFVCPDDMGDDKPHDMELRLYISKDNIEWGDGWCFDCEN